LFKIASVIEQHAKELGDLSTLEIGSPTMMAPFMVIDAAQKFRYFAGDWITGQVIHVDGGWVLRP